MSQLGSTIIIMLLLMFDAQAQVAPPNGSTYQGVAYASSKIVAGGTAQPVNFTLPHALVRCVQNPYSASEDLYVAFGANASTSSQDLPAGAQVCWAWNSTVSVYAATTGHSFIAVEGQ